ARGFSFDDSDRDLDSAADETTLITVCHAASVQGKIALGARAGLPIARLGARASQARVRVAGERCADAQGFSLHADVRIAARDRSRLERLCRYVLRPAIAT